jgi:hypothetical protein
MRHSEVEEHVFELEVPTLTRIDETKIALVCYTSLEICSNIPLDDQRRAHMENTKRKTPRKPSARGGGTIKALLLGLLSLFEVTFDILSLVSALLGGFVLDERSSSEASNTPSGTTEEANQVAPQITVGETLDKRPVGVTVIAILLGILALLEVGFGTIALVTSLSGSFILPLRSAAVGAALGVFYLLVGLVTLFFVWGLWRLRRWAFWATVCIVAVSLLSSVLAFTEPTPTAWVFLPYLLIPAVILIYFVIDSDVRAVFRI